MIRTPPHKVTSMHTLRQNASVLHSYVRLDLRKLFYLATLCHENSRNQISYVRFGHTLYLNKYGRYNNYVELVATLKEGGAPSSDSLMFRS